MSDAHHRDPEKSQQSSYMGQAVPVRFKSVSGNSAYVTPLSQLSTPVLHCRIDPCRCQIIDLSIYADNLAEDLLQMIYQCQVRHHNGAGATTPPTHLSTLSRPVVTAALSPGQLLSWVSCLFTGYVNFGEGQKLIAVQIKKSSMRRRQFLAAASTSIGAGMAGCSALDGLWKNSDVHPLAGRTQRVTVEKSSETDHDVEANAREAIEFWNSNRQEYTEFDASFELNDTNPDVRIIYADSPQGCESVEGYNERVLGCAPLLRSGRTIQRPVTARVVAAARPFGQIRTTTQHEIGHLLGLNHDDDPPHVMSVRPEDRIPLYQTRTEIWETVNTVQSSGTEGTRGFNDGITAYGDRNYESARDSFQNANETFTMALEGSRQALDRTDEFEGNDDAIETVELGTLRTHLDRLVRRMDKAVTFTGLMADASDAAIRDQRTEARNRVSEANEQIREFNAIESPQMRDIAYALGLVRGFDRDDSIVDVENEGV